MWKFYDQRKFPKPYFLIISPIYCGYHNGRWSLYSFFIELSLYKYISNIQDVFDINHTEYENWKDIILLALEPKYWKVFKDILPNLYKNCCIFGKAPSSGWQIQCHDNLKMIKITEYDIIILEMYFENTLILHR